MDREAKMQCPSCNTENPEQARFCLNCGAELTLVCPQCQTELPLHARFCFACGAELGPAQPAVTPSDTIAERLQRLVPKEYAQRLLATRGQVGRERRIVTILFSDVKGSTAMAENLDPEEVMEMMDGAFDVLIEPVYRYEGTLARLGGDAVLAFFGAPIAHEDDPERACRAALDIIEGAQEYAAQLQEERGIAGFDVRVGINTGLVVVGEVGSDLRVEYTAMGDAINLAARMESAAEPGTVLISEDTHRPIVHLFDTEALGPIDVKGRAEPVAVYRVLAPKAQPSRLRGVAGLESPLVGREAEFRKLQEAVERLQAGVGGIVTLVGEAGLGKSRLVAEIRRDVQDRAPHRKARERICWAEGHCLSYGTSIAYQLWLDILRGVLEVTAEDAPLAVRDALRKQVQSVCQERANDVYPYLARLMLLPLEAEDEATLCDLEGEVLKAATFRAVETLIRDAGLERPLALVCEDLHWADPTSIDLLERVLALTDRVSLLLICVFRPERERGAWRIKEAAARLYAHRHTDLLLDPLSTAESETLLSNLLQMPSLHKSFRQHVLSCGEGNPFYVEEIIRSLIDSGAIVRDEHTGGWQTTLDVADCPIPDTLRGVLMARIDRLPEEAKRVLQMASVIGRSFPYRLLAAIAQEEQDVRAHLLTLQRQQMIRELARWPELEYTFKHHLTEEAAYRSLLKKERCVLHRQVAETLEQLFSDRIEEQVEVLAHHWERAEAPEKAATYLLQAGDRARQVGASLEAIDFYQSALQKAAGLKEPAVVAELHLIHERLGDVYLVNLSRHGEALEHYASFLGLAKSEEDLARGARKVAVVHLLRGDLTQAQEYYERALAWLSSLPPLAETSRVHCGLAYLMVYRNRLEEAMEHARTSLEISRQIADARGLAEANKALGLIAHYRGELEPACTHFERSLELYRELNDLPRIAQACNNVGDSCRRLGQMDRALEHLNEGLEVAQRIGDTRDESLLLQTTAELLLDQGQWETAIAHLERALSLAQQSGAAERIIEVHLILGPACEAVGQLDDARDHLETADRLSREMQHLQFVPRIQLGLACLHATLADFDEAWRYVQLALDSAGADPSDAFLGLVQRCYGYLHARQGNWDDAVAHLEKSVEFLQQAKLVAELGKTRLRLGMAYASRGAEGDRGRACEQLLAALSIFRQIDARGYLAEVEVHLKETGCQPSS